MLLLAVSSPARETKTLRSLGALGDGKTDDRTAIQSALSQNPGAIIDGEGATYAVDGSIRVDGSVNFRNATIVQIASPVDVKPFIPGGSSGKGKPRIEPPEALRAMVGAIPLMRHDGVATYEEDPVLDGEDLAKVSKMFNLRTLFFLGTEEKPIAVCLENIRVLRGDHPDQGSETDASGIRVDAGNPITMTNVEVTGGGKGRAVAIYHSKNVKLTRLNIHDVYWSPYNGDDNIPAESLAKDFGWNNSPIYIFDDKRRSFFQMRVQEQVGGIHIAGSSDVEITDSEVHRLMAKIGGAVLPWQTDGITLADVDRVKMRNLKISNVWEGIDITGSRGDDVEQENIEITDTFSYGFKYAHVHNNVKVTNCTSIRAGMYGFALGSETNNMQLVNCHARETGASGYWGQGRAGFGLGGEAGDPQPNNVTLTDCSSVNEESPGKVNYGFWCTDGASAPTLKNYVINPKVIGASVAAVKGFAQRP